MEGFIKTKDIIEKFIQCEIDKAQHSNEYISALQLCDNLEDLIYEVGSWIRIENEYPSVAHYILVTLDV